MGSAQSSQFDEQQRTALRGGVLADYETIYNYFDDGKGDDDARLGGAGAATTGGPSHGHGYAPTNPNQHHGNKPNSKASSRSTPSSHHNKSKRHHNQNGTGSHYATSSQYGEHRRKSRSLYEESFCGAEASHAPEERDPIYQQGGGKRGAAAVADKIYANAGDGQHPLHQGNKTGGQRGGNNKSGNKLRTQKQINAELMARNAENQLREMEKKKYSDRTSAKQNRRSKSMNQQPIHVDTQSAEYWQKRRQLEKVLKSDELLNAQNNENKSQKKNKNSRKKELQLGGEENNTKGAKRDRSNNSNNNNNPEKAARKKERLKNLHAGDDQKANDTGAAKTAGKREGRATNRTEADKAKSRSRSNKSEYGAKKEKDTLAANTKTEAELLEELRQDDEKPMRPQDRARGELVSQHVPHYALPTRKMELRSDGRLSKLYVPKKPQYSSSEWPEDLDRNYCKLVVDTFKDMYSELISDPNWVYNQRKNYLNFLNTAEWQEMDLKLAKMSFNQLLQEEPLQKISTF